MKNFIGLILAMCLTSPLAMAARAKKASGVADKTAKLATESKTITTESKKNESESKESKESKASAANDVSKASPGELTIDEVNQSTAAVEPQTVKAEVSAPKTKLNLTGYYYNFEGTRGQKDDVYTFGDTTLRMDLLTLSYQATPNWTLMLIGQRYENYVITKAGGVNYTDRTQGVGDTIAMGMTSLVQDNGFLLFGDVGLSLPTGSIDERIPYAPTMNYPYNMQLGSGTTDVVVGLTPMFITSYGTFTSRASATVRTGQTKNDYTLGNLYRLDTSYDYNLGAGFTPRVVGYYKYKDAVRGVDKFRERSVFTEFYYHSQINWDVSLAMKYQKTIPGTNVAIGGEVGLPVAQDSQNYDHVVVSTEYYGNLSISGAF